MSELRVRKMRGVYQAGSREYAPPRTERSKARFCYCDGSQTNGRPSGSYCYVSLFGQEEERKESLMVLNKSKGFIRKELGTRLKVYYTPEISFEEDKSLDYGMHIEGLLKKDPRGGWQWELRLDRQKK